MLRKCVYKSHLREVVRVSNYAYLFYLLRVVVSAQRLVQVRTTNITGEYSIHSMKGRGKRRRRRWRRDLISTPTYPVTHSHCTSLLYMQHTAHLFNSNKPKSILKKTY